MPDASEKAVALDAVKSGISNVRASINILFAVAGKDGRGIIDIYRREFIEHYMLAL